MPSCCKTLEVLERWAVGKIQLERPPDVLHGLRKPAGGR